MKVHLILSIAGALVFAAGCNIHDLQDLQSGQARFSHGKVMIHGKASAKDASIVDARVNVRELQIRDVSGSFLTFTEQNFELSLSGLGDGVQPLLAKAQLPDGKYDQIRIITDEVGSVSFANGTTAELQFPSASQSGIKVLLDDPLEVVNGKIQLVSLDFDLSHSFVQQGNGRYLFKPVVKVEVGETVDSNPAGDSSELPEDYVSDGSSDSNNESSDESADSGSSDAGSASTTDGGTVPVFFPVLGV